MWNSLKSDLYRMVHTKSFYITLCMSMLVYLLIFGNYGVMSNTTFAIFNAETDSFTQYLYYLPKSGIFQCILLIFLSMFFSDEYISGFHKNVYPLQVKKYNIVIERFIFSFIVSLLYFICTLIPDVIHQLCKPLPFGDFDFLQYLLFMIIQILFICAVSGLISLIIHISRSRVVAVLLSIGYGMMFIYMILMGMSMFMFKDDILVRYSMYVNAGTLPETFSWSSYQTPLLVLGGTLVLYHAISYIILKKKDIA